VANYQRQTSLIGRCNAST